MGFRTILFYKITSIKHSADRKEKYRKDMNIKWKELWVMEILLQERKLKQAKREKLTCWVVQFVEQLRCVGLGFSGYPISLQPILGLSNIAFDLPNVFQVGRGSNFFFFYKVQELFWFSL